MSAAALIGVDWGTSSLRAYRITADGGVVDRREARRGIMTVADGDFAAALDAEIGDWADAMPCAPILLSGMIGSRQGWVEAPYVDCPAGAGEIAAAAVEISWRGRRLRVAPGLRCRTAGGMPDVMRGEETQLIGAVDALGAGRHRVCLPGTHSKWATLADGRILGFETYMTGELYDLLRRHSILGRLMPEVGAPDLAWFDAGVDRGAREGALSHAIFAARSLALTGEAAPAGLADFLSGVLIGHEIAVAASDAAAPVRLLGDPRLAERYARALARRGVVTELLDPDSASCGLARLARAG